MRVYLLSTAVAPLGSGLGGGVEHMVITAARQLHALGYLTTLKAWSQRRNGSGGSTKPTAGRWWNNATRWLTMARRWRTGCAPWQQNLPNQQPGL
ncbi:MAG: hypothetical protein F9K25_09260 [Candidatus Contendobacter sp.]|nr:MAG: hypothetical protein F9K25_09260 [Candidatus Contendobacter sp.]